MSVDPDGIVFGDAAQRYLDRLRSTWPRDDDLADEHGVTADTGRFLAVFGFGGGLECRLTVTRATY